LVGSPSSRPPDFGQAIVGRAPADSRRCAHRGRIPEPDAPVDFEVDLDDALSCAAGRFNASLLQVVDHRGGDLRDRGVTAGPMRRGIAPRNPSVMTVHRHRAPPTRAADRRSRHR
jgi:hypothetical protein